MEKNMKMKRVPFDIERAQKGAKVFTREGLSVRIRAYDVVSDYPILGTVKLPESGKEVVFSYTKEGKILDVKDKESKFDLLIEIEEDEECMKNALISYFQSFPYSLEDAGIDAKDAIAWLEKQGEKNTADKVKKEVKYRRMTHQELSWWLRECPEEHREFCFDKGRSSYSFYDYCLDFASEEVDCNINIRKNGGKWQKPLIEI